MTLLDDAEARAGRRRVLTEKTPPNSTHPAPPAPDGVAVIVAFYREHYRPVFRRGNAVVCADGREVPMYEACQFQTSALIARLATASDAPRTNNIINREALPAFHKRWAKAAWG